MASEARRDANTRLGDLVNEVAPREFQINLWQLAKRLENSERWIKEKLRRIEWTIALANILYSTRFYVVTASEQEVQPIRMMGWCMRGVYELNVRVRYVLESEQNMREWMRERETDELELLTAMLKIKQANPDDDVTQRAAAALRARQEEIWQTAARLGITLRKRPTATADLAKKVGMADDHAVVFKVASKFVHPSSYDVNTEPGGSGMPFYGYMFGVHLQILAYDTLGRINEALEVPPEDVESGVAEIAG